LGNFVHQAVHEGIMAALDPKIEQKVSDFWAAEKAAGGYKSRRQLYERYRQKVSSTDIGLSKFNELIGQLEEAGPREPFPYSAWVPWSGSDESPEDRAFLLRIAVVKRAETGEPLYSHEAKWAQWLRVALEDLHPYGQYKLVLAYSLREVIAYYLRQDRWTPDLDMFVAYKPWLPGRDHVLAYELALASGMAPKLKLDLFNPLSDLPLPEPESFEEEVRLSWTPQYLWWISPWGTHIPNREINPAAADMLDQILKFWAGIKATDVSIRQEEGVSDEREHS
jgi:hypothetical protein